MPNIGLPEIAIILVIALIVFGPRKLPEMGKSLGKMMAEFRKASADFKRTVEDEVEAEKYTQTALPAAAAVVPVDGMPVAPLDPEPELTTQPPDTPTVAREEHVADAAGTPAAADTESVKPA
ncbi:MAG: twin-arginine translocase TatA/TatE family subunit [Rhizobacter sp.]